MKPYSFKTSLRKIHMKNLITFNFYDLRGKQN